MTMKKCTYTITAEFDPEATTADDVAGAIDLLLDNALSSPGILDDQGGPTIHEVDGTLTEMLRKPDTDDAHYVLREVYKHMGVPLPGFLE